ncbi:uncharacterized protein ColSpa_10833 [Colletotrichum spaethianum]|uniref:Uncharacterized protein n=1 Tax=Colletotrichum spaethianum TaxID=700344 RepID=A0AA37PEF6_9PEZI|nr:uncharacterized protein ColSpa_10833 [Colletotrichum spaethianum]GKT50652.1 hypothetical protein ColSpa_10833 [Colletotrichum spaethianum]
MGSRSSGKRPSPKPTMTTSLNRVQGNARVQKTSASAATKKKSASKAAPKAETQTKNGEEAKKPTTFHPFGTKLPRELMALIVEEAADYGPAIAYGHCKAHKGDPKNLVLRTGREGGKSKFKELVSLAKALPNFQTIIERRFGRPLDENLSNDPRLGIRKEKDLMVFMFDKASHSFIDWLSRSQRKTNRATLARGIRNVGVRYNHACCKTFTCFVCGSCLKSRFGMFNCAWDLGLFCQSLSHVDNIFILVPLGSSDVVGTSLNKHEKLMKTLIAAQSINKHYIPHIVGADARRRVRFRVLVSSRWKDATLNI